MGFRDQGNQVTPVDDGGSFDTGQDTAIAISESATNALAAAVSAAAALVSQNDADASKTSAATSAATATTKASDALASATAANNSAATATTQAGLATTNGAAQVTLAANQVTLATNQVGLATTQVGLATTQVGLATVQANNASTSATTATTQAGLAAGSATAASGSATTAATKATESASSASASAISATASEAAKDAALEALDNFDDRFLGTKTTDPTLDNDGNALVAGALYYNTVSNIMKVYTGSIWVAAYASLSGALIAADNLSDVTNVSTSRTNLGLAIGTNVQAYTAILDATTASYTTALNTKMSGIEASADVTDTANVTAAGALMDSELANPSQVKTFSSSDYATAAQGTAAGAALPKAGGTMTGAILTNSTFDGRDVSVDGGKLDGISTNADVSATVVTKTFVDNLNVNAGTLGGDTKATILSTAESSSLALAIALG